MTPRTLKLLGATLFAAFLTPIAAAQQLEEIVVTAQFRAQNLQNVPITITALSGSELEKADIFDATGVAINTPGMSYGEFAPGQALIAMRGISSIDDGAGLDNSVALFLDGVYIGRLAGINFDMFDLDRIEVLKGPQGTLFGRNAIGGAISVITEKPSDEFKGKLGLTAGNEGILRVQGLVSGPLSENLSGKLVVNHREHDGYVRNTLLNQDLNDEDQTSVRGQLRWTGESSEWLLSADTMNDERVGMGRFPFVNGNFDYRGTAETLGANRPQTSASPTEGFSDRDIWGISLQGDIDYEKGQLTSITAIRNVESVWDMPSVGAPLGGGFNLGDPGDPSDDVFGADVIDAIDEDVETFSQEFRWTSNLDGNFNYVGGFYYFTEDTDRTEQFRIDFNSAATGQITVGNEYTRTENETTSTALYGQASYDYSDAWKFVFGARYTIDDRDYVATAVNCGLPDEELAAAGFANFAPCNGIARDGVGSLAIIAEAFRAPVSDSWNDFSPMVSAQFTPPSNDNLMFFGTISTGYKSGGFAGSQGIESAATNPVDPEDVTNFEVGMKGDFLDNTLRLNASLFFMDYTDLQVVRFGPVPNSVFGTFLTTNIGSADITGLEVDWNWNLSENFNITGNYAYLDTESDDLVINNVDLSGGTLRQAPKNSYNLTFNYDWTANSGNFDARLQFSHVDEQKNDYLNPATIIDEQDLVSARVGWTSNDEKYTVALWGKNLTDEEYVAHSYVIGPGVIGVWGAPQTFGVTATVNF